MRTKPLRQTILIIAALAAPQAPAWAQESPQQIQQLITNGQAQTALQQLQPALQAHPTSGVAWYLSAEAEDSLGNEPAARHDLAQAQHFAPGLPFARPADVSALQAHLHAANPAITTNQGGSGMGLGILIIGAFIVFFVISRLFRRRYQPGYGGFQNRAPDGYPPPGYGPGGVGPGMGSGVGGSLLSGLAAGAGFAVGERVVDDMMGRNDGGFIDPAQGQTPGRDDGLIGSPDWDTGSIDPGDPDDNFDPNNNW